jgi:C4-dicarboxylate-specific signal transduction histidine kinase
MGEMAAGLAHEINQPLSAIATYAQACQRFVRSPTRDDADVLEALEQISVQALRAGEVIRRLRNFVKNREVKREPVDCNRLLDDLRTLAETDARLHNVRLRIEAAAGAADRLRRSDPVAAGRAEPRAQRDRRDVRDARVAPRGRLLSTFMLPEGEIE